MFWGTLFSFALAPSITLLHPRRQLASWAWATINISDPYLGLPSLHPEAILNGFTALLLPPSMLLHIEFWGLLESSLVFPMSTETSDGVRLPTSHFQAYNTTSPVYWSYWPRPTALRNFWSLSGHYSLYSNITPPPKSVGDMYQINTLLSSCLAHIRKCKEPHAMLLVSLSSQ